MITRLMTYGARRGGATWYFLETSSLDATLARGRWATSKTARSYIDDGTLTLAQVGKWMALKLSHLPLEATACQSPPLEVGCWCERA